MIGCRICIVAQLKQNISTLLAAFCGSLDRKSNHFLLIVINHQGIFFDSLDGTDYWCSGAYGMAVVLCLK